MRLRKNERESLSHEDHASPPKMVEGFLQTFHEGHCLVDTDTGSQGDQ
jgi:hypothetical protein